MSAVASAIGVARPHLSAMRNKAPTRKQGRPPLPDAELVADIRALVADLPTYGYRRVHALLRRRAEKTGRAAPPPASNDAAHRWNLGRLRPTRSASTAS